MSNTEIAWPVHEAALWASDCAMLSGLDHLVAADDVGDISLLQLLGVDGVDEVRCPGVAGVVQVADLQSSCIRV